MRLVLQTIWIILLVILVLLLCWTRVGIQAKLADGILQFDAKIGLFQIHILPAKKKKKEKPTPKTAAKKKDDVPVKKKTKISLADIKDAVRTMWPPLKRTLDRTRRGIRIHPLTVSLTLGASEDPAAGAELYGYCHAGVWTVMPLLERLLVIPDPSIHIGIDFDASAAKVEGAFGLSARIGTLLRVAFTVAFPALRWFLGWRKKSKQAALDETTKQQTAA